MHCPIDGTELQKREHESGTQLDSCPRCGGTWLDRGELEKVEESREQDYSGELSRLPDLVGDAFEKARQRDRQDMRCLSCGTMTENREYAYASQVMINSCPSCGGVWLDEGELRALEVFFERSREDAAGLWRGFLRGLLGRK